MPAEPAEHMPRTPASRSDAPEPSAVPQIKTGKTGPGGLQMGMIVIAIVLLVIFVLAVFIMRGT